MTPRIESDQNVINFYDKMLHELCNKALKQGNIHPPFLVEFTNPEDNTKIFETKISLVKGQPEWERGGYPEFSGRLVINLREHVCLTRTIDTKNLTVMETEGRGATKEAANAGD